MSKDYINYISIRMKEMGYDNFHAGSLILEIKTGDTINHVKAYNEFLFLVSESIPSNVVIHSDTLIFSSDQSLDSVQIPYEFSGHVIITSGNTPDFSLEFIRVTPN